MYEGMDEAINEQGEGILATDFCTDPTVLYLDCINVNIPVVITIL